jgi:P27 family predicted phage terminase small subunit
LLTVADRGTFAGYCQAWARWRQCEEIIACDGLSVPGHRGIMRKHPLTSVAGRYLDAMRGFAQEFGLTPQARSRLSLPARGDEEEDSDLD